MAKSQKFNDTEAESVETITEGFGERKLIVPHSQRNYSWDAGTGKDQVGRLWRDLLEVYDGWKGTSATAAAEYLLGPMVFVAPAPDAHGNKQDELEIFDGQQRLATLMMIFCIARDITIELNTDKFLNEPSLTPDKIPGMDKLMELIENREPDPNATLMRRTSWKLQLNNVDKELFEKIILPYEAEGINDDFCDQGDRYKKINKKIQFFKEKIADHKKNKTLDGKPSNLAIMQAYTTLYQNIHDALLTNFDSDAAEVEHFIDSLKATAGVTVDKRLREPITSNAGTNDLGMKPDFFNDSLNGLDTLRDPNGWSATQKTDLDNEHQTWSARKVNKGKTFQQYIESKIRKKEKEVITLVNKPYSDYRDELIDVENDKLTKNKALAQLASLSMFCNSQLGKFLFSVKVVVEGHDDANTMFERLNERGIPLSKTNLAKNWILSRVADAKKPDLAIKWDKIFEKTVNPDDFLKESLKSRGFLDARDAEPTKGQYLFDRYPLLMEPKLVKPSDLNLYKIIKAKTPDERAVEVYVEELGGKLPGDDGDVGRCQKLDKPEHYPDASTVLRNQFRDPKPAITAIKNLGAEFIRLPILTAWRKWGNETDEFILLVKFLVPFFFRYKTVRNQTVGKLEALVLQACQIIENSDPNKSKETLDKIIKYFIQSDSESEFTSNFRERLAEPSATTATYILYNITRYLGDDLPDVLPVEKLTIEHVLPQHPKTKLDTSGTPEPDSWVEFDFFDSYGNTDPNVQALDGSLQNIRNKFGEFHKRLGNLTLLTPGLNSSLSNLNFLAKRDAMDTSNPPKPDGYNKSQLAINIKTIMKDENGNDRKEWTALSILERGEYFLDLAEKIWALPKMYCSDSNCPEAVKPTTRKDIEIDKIDNEKCETCGKPLTIKWPKDNSVEYRAPTAYQIT